MFMLKALGVILGIGLSVVFFTVLLGVGWVALLVVLRLLDRKSTRLNSSHT